MKKRNIFVMDYGLCNFHNLIKLVESGHTVYVTNTVPRTPHRAPFEYYKSLGINLVRDIDVCERESIQRAFLRHKNIDTIISTWPICKIPHSYRTKYNFIGHTPTSKNLEVEKLWCRDMVERLGVKVPRRLDDVSVPCVVKPIEIKLGNDGDHASICLNEDHVDYVTKTYRNFYVEEYIPDTIEANVEFVVSHGKYSIMHTQEVLGEDVCKHAGNFTHFTKHASYKKLSDENLELTLLNAKTILEWAVTLGGSYQGQITGLIKDGEWYFCEINGRPEQSNSLPQFITGDEWLEAMNGKPEILGDSYGEVQKVVLQPKEPNSPYPFHLHEKYGVSIPCGLDILGGKHRVSRQFRDRSSDKCIGIIVVDRHIPQEFIDEVKKDSNFFVSHCFL